MDMTTGISIVLALAAASLVVLACRMLVVDARGGFEVSMGGEMLYTQLWIVAGALAGGALTLSDYGGWWLIIVGVVLFYIIAQPIRRLIKAMYLGADVPAESLNKSGGFAAMSRKAEEIVDEQHKSDH